MMPLASSLGFVPAPALLATLPGPNVALLAGTCLNGAAAALTLVHDKG